MNSKRVGLVGSHGLNASYGGWDQLVNNLCGFRSRDISYVIFNPRENVSTSSDPGVDVVWLPFSKRRSFEGLIADYYAVCKSFACDTLLLLGMKAVPVALLLKVFSRDRRVVVNIGGIEWRRPQFGALSKVYLRICFWLSLRFADVVVLDNGTYKRFVPSRFLAKTRVISYGGFIDASLSANDLLDEYSFLKHDFYLSVSRAIEDNGLEELCQTFQNLPAHHLVLISNFSSSPYGLRVLAKYSGLSNLTLIDGLYDKPKLDCIRRACFSYIHTHTQCGSAPSLIEMIVARRPIISIDVPQNRETTKGQVVYFQDYESLQSIVRSGCAGSLVSLESGDCDFSWSTVVKSYESLY